MYRIEDTWINGILYESECDYIISHWHEQKVDSSSIFGTIEIVDQLEYRPLGVSFEGKTAW